VLRSSVCILRRSLIVRALGVFFLLQPLLDDFRILKGQSLLLLSAGVTPFCWLCCLDLSQGRPTDFPPFPQLSAYWAPNVYGRSRPPSHPPPCTLDLVLGSPLHHTFRAHPLDLLRPLPAGRISLENKFGLLDLHLTLLLSRFSFSGCRSF